MIQKSIYQIGNCAIAASLWGRNKNNEVTKWEDISISTKLLQKKQPSHWFVIISGEGLPDSPFDEHRTAVF